MSKKTIDVVTIGESMVLFQPLIEGTLTYAPMLSKSVGGAESNVALSLQRLGKKSRWISRVGHDPFGDLIISTLSGEGVDISKVIRDPNAPTAVFFKESKGYGDPNVYYYRKGSAASRLMKEEIRPDWFADARHLHVTGITPALGDNTTEMLKEAMIQARKEGLTVSFDPNLRKKLWDEEKARTTLLSLIPYCDIFMPGLEEAEFLVGERNEEDYCTVFEELGATLVVLKLGTRGSLAKVGSTMIKADPYKVDYVVDTVGAGDAFAAGLLSILLREDVPLSPSTLEQNIELALKRANIMGALATQFKGDWEGCPTKTEVEHLEEGKQTTTR
ncbi:sugar kinase [Alkalihalobacillus sp. LMS39]|uniref:sugar kinase n=1 Tax=Alkalihalobacillus sp. LMS39 TaxID=2924032 RepID=UPI001FB55554|nr:sugar kinase [Alkalihalobacillus sp. LMS39]UOE94944.1 sugar kinase [Alkalihalobacillus sp. LMS39]